MTIVLTVLMLVFCPTDLTEQTQNQAPADAPIAILTDEEGAG